MSNMDPPPQKKREYTHVLTQGKQFLFPIRYPPCYSYIGKSSKSLAGDRGKKGKGEMIACYLRNGYFITVNQCVMTMEIVQQ